MCFVRVESVVCGVLWDQWIGAESLVVCLLAVYD